MAFMKYGEEDRRSETSLHACREHARQLVMRMSSEDAELDMDKLESLSFDLPFDELPAYGEKILAGAVRGRAVVQIAS